ncbi:hypothetical protein AMECASPLE_010560 [Ameca splendens]|uniref:Uncharacterized protein n=1 Tax=Ameca splendens TaxID=208324 RepID=A0ABV0ZLB6_9TELE
MQIQGFAHHFELFITDLNLRKKGERLKVLKKKERKKGRKEGRKTLVFGRFQSQKTALDKLMRKYLTFSPVLVSLHNKPDWVLVSAVLSDPFICSVDRGISAQPLFDLCLSGIVPAVFIWHKLLDRCFYINYCLILI